MRKKILWITDDHKNNEEIYKELWEDIGELKIIEDFVFLPDIDFVMVDYGCLNYLRDHKWPTTLDNVCILEKYYKNRIPIIWTGGFGGTRRYIEDVKRLFPDHEWLHTIASISLEDLRWYVAKELEESQKEMRR